MMNSYTEGTFYLVTDNPATARRLMAAFLAGENCPECQTGGRYFGGDSEHVSGGFACECLTYELTQEIETCQCDVCAIEEEEE